MTRPKAKRAKVVITKENSAKQLKQQKQTDQLYSLFKSKFGMLMHGFGDVPCPLPETVDLMYDVTCSDQPFNIAC